MDTELLAYVAGMIDGEGSLVISQKSSNPFTSYSATIQVQMSAKASAVVSLIHARLGGSLTLCDSEKPGQSASIRWGVSGQSVRCILRLLEPFLRLKHVQAHLIIELLETDEAQFGVARKKWTADRAELWETAKARMTRLNAKGPSPTPEGVFAERVGNRWVRRTADLFGERWETFSGTFPASGSMRNGACSARPAWEPPTCGSGSSSSAGAAWPTPDAGAGTGYNQTDSPGAAKRPLLALAAALWYTLNVPNGGRYVDEETTAACGRTEAGKRQVGLESQTRLWASPMAKDGGKRSAGNRKGDDLSTQTELWASPKTPTGGPEGRGSKATRGSGGGDLQEMAGTWARPGASDGKGSAKPGQRRGQLSEQAEILWPTPLVSNGERTEAGLAPPREAGQMVTLQDEALMWATPRGEERAQKNSRDAGMALSLQTSLFSLPVPATTLDGPRCSAHTPASLPPLGERKRLSPRFEEWLMGVPLGWAQATRPLGPTSYACWGMAFSQLVRRLVSSSCGGGFMGDDGL